MNHNMKKVVMPAVTLTAIATALTGCASNYVDLMNYKDRHGNVVTASGKAVPPQDAGYQQAASGHWETPGESMWVTKTARDGKKIIHWDEEIKPDRVWVEYPEGTIPPANPANPDDCELIAGRRVANSALTSGGVQLAETSGCTVQETKFQNGNATHDRSYVEQASELIHARIDFEVTNQDPDQTNIQNGAFSSSKSKSESESNIHSKNVDIKKGGHDNHHGGGDHGGCKKKDKHGNDTCFFNPKTGELVTSINGERISNRPAPRSWAEVAKKSFFYG